MNLKNKKKIRIVIGSLNVGGTEKQVLNIVNYLAKKSWKIELITLKERGILAKYLNKEIKTNNLNIKTSFKVISFFKIIHKLFKIFKKDPFTLTHFFLPQAYILGMIWSFSTCTATSKVSPVYSSNHSPVLTTQFRGLVYLTSIRLVRINISCRVDWQSPSKSSSKFQSSSLKNFSRER